MIVNTYEVEATWTAIQGRIDRRPTFQVVDEDAIALIESVIMKNHEEAFDLFPGFSLDDKKQRVQFWKDRVIDAVLPAKAGLFAVYFHEYIASIERANAASFDEDDEPTLIPSYGGHARAAHDAWVACTASLS